MKYITLTRALLLLLISFTACRDRTTDGLPEEPPAPSSKSSDRSDKQPANQVESTKVADEETTRSPDEKQVAVSEPLLEREEAKSEILRTIQITGPAEVPLFNKIEFDVTFPPRLLGNISQIHDAYDADNNGAYVNPVAVFKHEASETVRTVPCFFMKQKPHGDWKLKARFAPRLTGKWTAKVNIEAGVRSDGNKDVEAYTSNEVAFLSKKVDETGPMVLGDEDQNPSYLYYLSMVSSAAPSNRKSPDHGGGKVTIVKKPFLLRATCRAWVSKNREDSAYRDTWIDREKELFKPMHENNVNLLNMWMAPWEFMIIHRKPSEFWPQKDQAGRDIEAHFDEYPLDDPRWKPYMYYDQGRAVAMDRILRQAEAYNEDSKTHIYLMLCVIPHVALQPASHSWNRGEDSWNLEPDSKKPQEVIGFSGFKENMNVYDFFRADPSMKDKNDWRRQLWDHQANFFRYVIARWGYSRAIGMWVLMDELDGTADERGVIAWKSGWWSTRDTDTWHDNMLRMFRGKLLGYLGDPFQHPLTSSSTNHAYKSYSEKEKIWDGGEEKVDIITFHVYPIHTCYGRWVMENETPKYKEEKDSYGMYAEAAYNTERIKDDTNTWSIAAQAIHDWTHNADSNKPKMVTEFGYVERTSSDDRWDIYGKRYPTVFHYAIWASLVSGHASLTADWNDGKEFGEMKWRERKGDFEKGKYLVDNYNEIKNVVRYLEGEDISRCAPLPQSQIKIDNEDLTAWCIANEENEILGWLFVNKEPAKDYENSKLEISGMNAEKEYRITWFNTWTGTAIGKPEKITNTDGVLGTDLKNMISESVSPPEKGANDFGNNPYDWKDDGKDVAFKIVAGRFGESGKVGKWESGKVGK